MPDSCSQAGDRTDISFVYVHASCRPEAIVMNVLSTDKIYEFEKEF